MKLVLDTNILVSGLLSPSGPPGRIVDALQTGRISPVVDDRILAEYSDVLKREKFSRWIAKWEAEAVLQFFESEGIPISSPITITDLPDPSDAPFLESALEADVPLVTGNLKHFPPEKRRNVQVLSAAEFCASYLND